jgi:lysyl-tRNA synthetase class 2
LPLEPSPWWRPEIHADRRAILMARNRIREAMRDWFFAERFTEVECNALQVSPGNEAHLHAIEAPVRRPDGSTVTLYLHTSPEFACKKLLAAGELRIFDFARVYRDRERTPLHAPEFTMLEWYRAHEHYERVLDDAVTLLRLACEAGGTGQLSYRGKSADPRLEPQRVTVAQAFAEHAGIDLLHMLDRDRLSEAAQARGIRIADNDSWSDIFSRVLVQKIEPHLGLGRPTIIYEYPIGEAALARPCPHDPRVAERFELYACGVEIANGFGELTDSGEQRRRFEEDMALKMELYGERYPIDDEFLAALAIMPEASGVAMGFDRVVMLATGTSRIDQVQWTPLVAGND